MIPSSDSEKRDQRWQKLLEKALKCFYSEFKILKDAWRDFSLAFRCEKECTCETECTCATGVAGAMIGMFKPFERFYGMTCKLHRVALDIRTFDIQIGYDGLYEYQLQELENAWCEITFDHKDLEQYELQRATGLRELIAMKL